MITIEKLNIYKNYAGDADHLQRINNAKDINVIFYEEWSILTNLSFNLRLIRKGLASKEFEQSTLTTIGEVCESNAINKLHEVLENIG